MRRTKSRLEAHHGPRERPRKPRMLGRRIVRNSYPQMRTAPRMTPLLLPLPPAMTMAQMMKVSKGRKEVRGSMKVSQWA